MHSGLTPWKRKYTSKQIKTEIKYNAKLADANKLKDKCEEEFDIYGTARIQTCQDEVEMPEVIEETADDKVWYNENKEYWAANFTNDL